MTIEWTPKEQRSRNKWRQILAQFQYENGMSREEMAQYFKQMATEKTDQIETDPPPKFNSADYVLNYLLPPRRKG